MRGEFTRIDACWLRGRHNVSHCGCGVLNENDGDPRHLMMDAFRTTVRASQISVDEAIKNIADAFYSGVTDIR